MKKTMLFLILTGLFSGQSFAQDYRRFALKAGMGNHQVGFPYQNLLISINPALSFGSEIRYNKSERNQLLQTFDFRIASNKELGQSVALTTSLLYRRHFGNQIFIGTGLGIGLVAQQSPREAFVQNSQNDYEKIEAAQTQGMLLQVPFTVGFDMSKRRPLMLSIDYMPYIQVPYFDAASFPFMPQSVIQFSITFKFKK